MKLLIQSDQYIDAPINYRGQQFAYLTAFIFSFINIATLFNDGTFNENFFRSHGDWDIHCADEILTWSMIYSFSRHCRNILACALGKISKHLDRFADADDIFRYCTGMFYCIMLRKCQYPKDICIASKIKSWINIVNNNSIIYREFFQFSILVSTSQIFLELILHLCVSMLITFLVFFSWKSQ